MGQLSGRVESCDGTDVWRRFTCGAYVALLPNPMIEFGETADVGRRIGMFTTIFAAGALVGPPISGAISVATGGFEAVGYYAGMMREHSLMLTS